MDLGTLCVQRASSIVRQHIQLAQSEGFCFGAKIVRGAYLDEVCNQAVHGHTRTVAIRGFLNDMRYINSRFIYLLT